MTAPLAHTSNQMEELFHTSNLHGLIRYKYAQDSLLETPSPRELPSQQTGNALGENNNTLVPYFEAANALMDSVAILDVTSGHKGMQKEIAERFGVTGEITSLDVRPKMTNGMTPDIVADSRKLPFPDASFGLILFDPPFSFHGGKSCGSGDYNRFYVTYGLNLYTSRAELGEYIRQSFAEIWRVLRDDGCVLFKWSESRIKLEWALALRGEFHVAWKWPRPSKHWGTKTGTATWYVCLTKSPDVIPVVGAPTTPSTSTTGLSNGAALSSTPKAAPVSVGAMQCTDSGLRYPEAPGFKRTGTSQVSAKSVEKEAKSLREQCLAVLREKALTADEVAMYLHRSVLSIRPRIAELSALGKIVDSGERRINQSGHRAIVWRANA